MGKKTRTIFLDIVGYSNRNKILEILITGRELPYHLSDINVASGVSRPTCYKEINRLVKRKVIRKFKCRRGYCRKLPLYQINFKNDTAKVLIKIFDEIINKNLKAMSQ